MILIINFKKLKITKEKFIKFLNKKSIFPQYHYIPIYKFSYFKFLKRNHSFKNSESYYKSALSLPIFYDLNKNSLMKIIKNVKGLIKKYQNKNVKK